MMLPYMVRCGATLWLPIGWHGAIWLYAAPNGAIRLYFSRVSLVLIEAYFILDWHGFCVYGASAEIGYDPI
jgi:hypothetical protein